MDRKDDEVNTGNYKNPILFTYDRVKLQLVRNQPIFFLLFLLLGRSVFELDVGVWPATHIASIKI